MGGGAAGAVSPSPATARRTSRSGARRRRKGASVEDLTLSEFQPRPTLVSEQHQVPRARFPAIDAHNHLGRWLTSGGAWGVPDVEELIGVMDACNIAAIVNLDGMWGDELEANLD